MRRSAVLAMLLSGCALPAFDYDGDGWAGPDDCDDLDPDINAGAEELVGDGVDQDCDHSDTLERASGLEHVCDLDARGRIDCVADPAASHDLLEVPEPHSGAMFVAIAAGDFHTCALDSDGFVACWGDDTYGQSSPPVNGRFVGINAFDNVSLGERADDPAICWGDCIASRSF